MLLLGMLVVSLLGEQMCDRGCGKVLEESTLVGGCWVRLVFVFFKPARCGCAESAPTQEPPRKTRFVPTRLTVGHHHTPETQHSAELTGLPALRTSLGGREPAHLQRHGAEGERGPAAPQPSPGTQSSKRTRRGHPSSRVASNSSWG